MATTAKKHGLPTLARLSSNGNFLVEHPITGQFHWFKVNGEYLNPLETEIQWSTDDDDEYEEIVPEYVWDMICIPINRFDGSWNQPNNFIARFPTVGNDYQPSPYRNMGLDRKRGNGERRGSDFETNICGRKFRKCYNPSQFVNHYTDETEEIFIYRKSPSRYLGNRGGGNWRTR